MRLRRIPQAQTEVDSHALVLTEQKALSLAGCWQRQFAAARPLVLEIGMGQGRFLYTAATAQPHYNYIGLERRAEPILYLLKQVKAPYPPNLRLLHAEAALLTDIFAPGELSLLYMLFPDPWPKNRHAKRRLTSPAFIKVYQRILEPAGRMIFKTDGAAFYHWSCTNFREAGWSLTQAAEDQPPAPQETVSSYERRFRKLGQPIYYAEFISPPAT